MCTLIRYVGVMGSFFLNAHHYCLVGCLSMIVWTNTFFSCLRCIILFCIFVFEIVQRS